MFKSCITRQLIEAGYALAVAGSIGIWAFYFAYLERGHPAVGAEYFIVIVVFWLAYKAIHKLFNVLEEEKYAGR